MSDDGIFSGVHEVAVELPTAPEAEPGLVLKWRRRGDLWEGLVSREVDGRIVTDWIPAIRMSPVASVDAATAPEDDEIETEDGSLAGDPT